MFQEGWHHRAFWSQAYARLSEGICSELAETMEEEILAYLSGRTERVLGSGEIGDVTEAIAAEFIQGCELLSTFTKHQTSEARQEAKKRLNYLSKLRDSEIFKGSVVCKRGEELSREHLLEFLICKYKEVEKIAQKWESLESSRDRFEKLIKFSKKTTRGLLQVLWLMLRKEKVLWQRSVDVDFDKRRNQEAFKSTLETASGKLLVKTVQKTQEISAQKKLLAGPLDEEDVAKRMAEFSATNAMHNATGIDDFFLSVQERGTLTAWIELHGLVITLARLTKLAERGFVLSGKGGDLLVLGLLNYETKLMELLYDALIKRIESQMDLLLRGEDRRRELEVGREEREPMDRNEPWPNRSERQIHQSYGRLERNDQEHASSFAHLRYSTSREEAQQLSMEYNLEARIFAKWMREQRWLEERQEKAFNQMLEEIESEGQSAARLAIQAPQPRLLTEGETDVSQQANNPPRAPQPAAAPASAQAPQTRNDLTSTQKFDLSVRERLEAYRKKASDYLEKNPTTPVDISASKQKSGIARLGANVLSQNGRQALDPSFLRKLCNAFDEARKDYTAKDHTALSFALLDWMNGEIDVPMFMALVESVLNEEKLKGHNVRYDFYKQLEELLRLYEKVNGEEWRLVKGTSSLELQTARAEIAVLTAEKKESAKKIAELTQQVADFKKNGKTRKKFIKKIKKNWRKR